MWFVILRQVCLLMVHVCSCIELETITDTAMLRFDPPNLSVLEGNDATLTCNISNSEAGVYYIVRNNNTSYVFHPQDNCRVAGPLLNNTQEYNVRCIAEDVQITILNVSRDRHGEIWTCRRTIFQKRYESSSHITVRVPITNVRFEKQRDYTVTKTNISTEFVCVSSAAYPEASIQWYKNNSLFTNGHVTSSSTTSNTYPPVVRNTLSLYMTRADNSTQIHCAAHNSGTTWKYSNKTSVIVYYAPDVPNITKGTSQVQGDLKVIQGNAVDVVCTTIGFPEPYYSWTTPNGSTIIGRRLFIANISRNEDGRYICKANNTMKLSSGKTYHGENITSIIVSVLYPPRQLTVKYVNASSNKQYNITNALLYVVRNDSFILICTTDSQPLSTYRWTGHSHLQETNNNTLTVVSIQDDMNLACTATNTMNETFGMTSTHSTNSTISFNVLYPPRNTEFRATNSDGRVIENIYNVNVTEGDTITVTCQADSRPTPYGYYWSEDTSVNSATMQLTDVKRTEAETYSCEARNRMNRTFGDPAEGRQSQSLNINVLYPTHIDEFEINGQRNVAVTVNETDNITFVCKVDGKPASHVSILYEGQSLKQATVMNNVSHTVTNVTCVQIGQYACTANNSYSRESAKSNLTVFVRCSPRPKPDSELQVVFASALNVDTTISFELLAYPAPSENGFKWEKEITNGSSWKEVDNNDNILVSSFGVQSNLTLKYVSRSSFGNYRLTVTNDVGTYTHQFVMSAEDKPQAPTNFHHVEELTTDSTLTFKWSPGFDGGPLQTFVLHYRQTNSKTNWFVQSIPDNGSPIMNTTLGFLTSSTMYDVNLLASNAIGNSSAVEITAVQTSVAEVPAVGNRIIPAVAGVAASLVVICVIVVISVLYKRRHNIKDSSKMHHGATTANVSSGMYENVFSHRNDDPNNDGPDNKSNIYQNAPDLHIPSSATSSKQPSSKKQKEAVPVPSNIIYENLLLKAL